MCIRVDADVDLCECVPACVNSSSRRPATDTRLGCVHTQRQTWLYKIKGLLKRNRASVGIKSRGRREDREWKTVWQKQANSAERKRVQERLTDRRVRIIDRGSDRESMWCRDNRQIDGFCQGREVEGEEQGRQRKAATFCCKLQNGASEELCLPLQHSPVTLEGERYSSSL